MQGENTASETSGILRLLPWVRHNRATLCVSTTYLAKTKREEALGHQVHHRSRVGALKQRHTCNGGHGCSSSRPLTSAAEALSLSHLDTCPRSPCTPSASRAFLRPSNALALRGTPGPPRTYRARLSAFTSTSASTLGVRGPSDQFHFRTRGRTGGILRIRAASSRPRDRQQPTGCLKNRPCGSSVGT